MRMRMQFALFGPKWHLLQSKRKHSSKHQDLPKEANLYKCKHQKHQHKDSKDLNLLSPRSKRMWTSLWPSPTPTSIAKPWRSG